MKTDNDGDMLISPKLVTSEGVISPTPYGKVSPAIVLDSEENILMLWVDERNDDNLEVYFLKLDSDGDVLIEEEIRLTDNSVDSLLSGMALDANDNLHFGLVQLVGENYQVFLGVIDSDGDYILEPHQLTATESLSNSATFAFDSRGFLHMAFVDTITTLPEVYLTLLKSLTIELAFVPTGVSGGVLDLEISEDQTVIEELQIERSKGKPIDEAVFVTFTIDPEKSYTIDVEYTPPPKKGGTGAVPLKLYIVENGEFGKQISPTMVNKKKQTASFEMDDFIESYF
jgi:hypothetical protein